MTGPSIDMKPEPSRSLHDKVAVFIGGTGVLGGAIARGFAQVGANVVLVGRDAAKGEATRDAILAAGGTARVELCDATRHEALRQLLARVLGHSGRVDILVNAAGVNSATPFLEIDEEEVERILAVNLKSVFWSCQIFGDQMLRQGEGGSIINIGSVSGIVPLSRVFTYSLSKAAVHNLSKNLAREWGPQGVRVNVLVPGFIPAEQNRKVLSPDRVASILARTPLGRFGEPCELVGACVLLASDAGRFITGAELVVDGGFLAQSI